MSNTRDEYVENVVREVDRRLYNWDLDWNVREALSVMAEALAEELSYAVLPLAEEQPEPNEGVAWGGLCACEDCQRTDEDLTADRAYKKKFEGLNRVETDDLILECLTDYLCVVPPHPEDVKDAEQAIEERKKELEARSPHIYQDPPAYCKGCGAFLHPRDSGLDLDDWGF